MGDVIDVEDFRLEVRAWLDERYDRLPPDADDGRLDVISRAPDGHQRLVERAERFQQLLHEAGFSGLDLPKAYGGKGLARAHVKVLSEELRRYDTPSLVPLGIGPTLAKSTLLAAGTEKQKRTFLPGLASGQERWCQLFSEPDAGSDLVSLRTRAVFDGDVWVVNGQKVWSSYAVGADFGMLLARTDPNADRPQAGITMFILPMSTPGVSVRPLVDIAGGEHFNEVFLAHVQIPAELVLGEVNGGWGVSAGTLSGERSGYMGGSGNGRRRRQVVAAATAASRLDDPVLRQRIVLIITSERILEFVRDRFVSGLLCDGNRAAGSMMKLAAGTLEQQCAELLADLGGASSQAWDPDDPDGDIASHGLNATRQARIAGGTHEIQRNLVGERVLGLPREPRIT